MNDQIKELAEQAGLKSEIMLDESSRGVECFVTQVDGSVPSVHLWEKFAELLIKECIDCAEWVGKMNTNAVEPVHTANAISNRIAKQFGVK